MAEKHLGTPVHTVAVAAAGYDPEGAERPKVYAVSSGKTATLYVIDVQTGRILQSAELEGTTHTWGVAVAPDGAVYMSSSQGYLHRWRPGEDKAENLGKPIPGESFVWRLACDEQGRIYGGTYDGGKVFRYDPVEGIFRDYGRMTDSEKYARSIAAGGGAIYVGVGTQRARLYEVDAESGAKREIPFPEGYEKDQTVYDVTKVGEWLFARTVPSNTLHVYDLQAKRWTDAISDASGLDVSCPSPDSGKLYLVRGNRLHSYDPETKELAATDISVQGAKDFGWVRLEEADYPGWSLVSAKTNGDFWLYNPQSGHCRHVEVNVPGQPNKAQTLTLSSDGTLWVGGFFSGGFAKYDPVSERLTEYRTFGQQEGMVEFKGSIYAGVYPGARIYRYDPKAEYRADVNPIKLFALNDRYQDRPFAMVAAGDALAIGTVPYYGQHGGALTLYDPDTGKIDVYRHIAGNQSVVCLAYREGILYGGTSIHGGLGTEPETTAASLFRFDADQCEKGWTCVPVPEAKVIYSIALAEDGMLWGLTYRALFRFDPMQRKTVEIVPLEGFNPDFPESGWIGGTIRFHEDGCLYGTALGQLFRYKPGERSFEILADKAAYFAQNAEGTIYFTRGTELYEYRLDN